MDVTRGSVLVALTMHVFAPSLAFSQHDETSQAVELLGASMKCAADVRQLSTGPLREQWNYLGNASQFRARKVFQSTYVAKMTEGPPLVHEASGTATYIARFRSLSAPVVKGTAVTLSCKDLLDCFYIQNDVQRCITRNGEKNCGQDPDFSRKEPEVYIEACTADAADDIKVALEALMRRATTMPSGETLWMHNGSQMVMTASGNRRTIMYSLPKQGLKEAGVEADTVLFDGAVSKNGLSGDAYRFSRKCGSRRYEVAGSITEKEKIVLRGSVGKLGPDCKIAGSMVDELLFTYVGEQ